MSWKKIEAQQNKNVRSQMLSKLISSFTVTTVVAVAAVVVVTNSPKPTADFLSLSAVGNTIVYRVQVLDPELAISNDSLKMYVESPYEQYVTPISVGTTYGTHEMAHANSEYTFYVKASLGYGEETLAKSTVKSSNALSAAVVNFVIDPELDLQTHPETLRYLVTTAYSDPLETLSGIYLEYGYYYTYASESSQSQPMNAQNDAVPDNFTDIPLSSPNQETWIEGIPNYNYTVVLRIVADLNDASRVVLDELEFNTPFTIDAYAYISDIGYDYVDFVMYQQANFGFDITFSLSLYKDDVLLETDEFVNDSSSSGIGDMISSMLKASFANLAASTNYSAELSVKYVDPYTFESRNFVAETIPFMTLPTYQYFVTAVDNISSIDVTITVNDPNNVLQSLYYEVLATIGGVEQYLSYGPLESLAQGEANRVYFASIAKPTDVESFKINIYCTKMFGEASYYGCFLYSFSA